jgi:YD repeat-containing protein
LSSTTQYNYYFGAVTQTQGPALAGQTVGPIQTMQYDAAGRISRVDNASNGAWKYWAYPDRQDAVQTLTTINSTSLSYYQIAVVDGAGRLRAQGGDLPNSTGLYWGQFTYYDVMGRVSQTSNPAEITSVWTPTGEDAAGWVWTQQAYDWKGRPTIKTNPDGTTNEASYGGCGCAGGEVVTTRDEVGRQQKVTSDVLGRVYKTEILNWDGSPYSTIINTYNARDQITSAKHYQGTDASGVYQESTAAYDGYGRLVSSHAPDQRDQNNQSLSTTYTYYADDTRNVVTDARGATTSFSYNNRHQVTGISYTAPAGITVPAAVSFAYDAVGNRTGMTDGLGSISYNYDQLSRLTSETRNFTGVGSFTLQYGYNLSGEVTSVTDQWNAQAIYNYDHTGRLQSVTGAGGGASTYASNMQYRAWGALKHLSYGNNLNLDLTYNNRLQATKYDLVNAGSGARVMGREYQYTTTPTSTDNDGRVKYSRDLVSDNLDRTYTYNHTGNLQSAKAGVYQQNGSYYSGPFEQGYSYDEWDNLTGRSWRTFGHFGNITFAQHPSYSENYVNNRNTTAGWQYDANGNLLTATGDGQTRQYTYDAAGMMLTSSQSGKNITQAFDGDGQKVKFVENGTVTYYVRSSALGGQTLSEVNQSGAKVRGYVYAGGVIIAKQEGSQVLWDQKDVSGVSMRLTNSSGTITSKVETDPLGTQVDDTANYNYSGGSGAFNPMGFYGDPQQPNMGCSSDGVPTPCSMVAMSLRAGAARQCPNNYCGTTAVYDHAANNGRGGYVVGALGTNPNTGALGYWTWQRWHTSASGPDSSDGSIVRIGSSGMRPVFHSLQQGPDPYFGLGPPPPPRWPVSKEDKEFFRGILEEQLKNPKCGGFLNPLFEAVKDKTNRDYSPVLQAFDETTFYWGRPEGWYGGYATWEHGKRIAIISENFKTEKFISKDRTAVLTEMTAGIFFGETLHHVGNPIYTDADYANVINAIRGDNLPAFSDRTKFEVFRASNYFHHNADAACPIPRK